MKKSVGLAFGLALVASSAYADALLDQIVAGAKADKQVQWSVDRTNADFDTDGKLKTTSIAHFNGAAAKGARWSLLSVDGKMPAASAEKEFSKMFNGGDYKPTYAQVADLLSGAVTKISPNCYRLTGLPAKTVMAAGYDLSPFLQADVFVDSSGTQPYVSQVKISAPKPFKPMRLSTVSRLERVMNFVRGPQGLPVMSSSAVISDFKVIFKTIALRTKTEFHAQKPLIQTAQNSISEKSN
jgi:hypothetical protein